MYKQRNYLPDRQTKESTEKSRQEQGKQLFLFFYLLQSQPLPPLTLVPLWISWTVGDTPCCSRIYVFFSVLGGDYRLGSKTFLQIKTWVLSPSIFQVEIVRDAQVRKSPSFGDKINTYLCMCIRLWFAAIYSHFFVFFEIVFFSSQLPRQSRVLPVKLVSFPVHSPRATCVWSFMRGCLLPNCCAVDIFRKCAAQKITLFMTSSLYPNVIIPKYVQKTNHFPIVT